MLDEALSTSPPDALVRDVIRPLFRRLQDRADPAAIRFAASLLEVRMLAHARGWERIEGPVAVLACGPRDDHVLGLIGLGLGLAERHCRISYLGAATPVTLLSARAREQGAAVVVITADTPDLLAGERAELRRLALGVPLLTTGRAAGALAEAIGGRPLPDDPPTAAARAAGLAGRVSSRQGDDGSPGLRRR